MIIEQRLDEICSYVKKLERDLAEADALISTHQHKIDDNPESKWPNGSILKAAVLRHIDRVAKETYLRAMRS